MSSLAWLLIIILISIALIVALSSLLKIHPFLSLIAGSLFVGFFAGIDGIKILEAISSGFGSILAHIGLIVALGTIIGVMLEQSGALQAISDWVISLFGSKHSITAMAVLGSLVGIPVFCDSGFVILSKLSKYVANKQGISSAGTSIALASGLYTTHTLIPPTPGPIAAAGNIGASDYLGLIILVGVFIAIPVMIVSILFAKKVGNKLQMEEQELAENPERKDQMSLIWAVTPLAFPILFISLSSIFKLLDLSGGWAEIFHLIGHPFLALLLGLVLAMIQLLPKVRLKGQSELFKNGIIQAGPILLITGAGGSFGAVLKSTELSSLLTKHLQNSPQGSAGILILAFILAALLKTAQGSSTSALVIGSSVMAPILLASGLSSPIFMALTVSALGAGAMTVSHANDSYFWIVTQFSGFSLKQGYRGFTLLTFLQGITAMVIILLLSWVF